MKGKNMMYANIKDLAKENINFRRVLFTGPHSQLVLMSLKPGEDIGEETHTDTDQLLFVVKGEGEAVLDGQTVKVEKHSVVLVPAGTKHNFKNTNDDELKLYTVYSSPAHKDGLVQKTKEEGEMD